MAATAFLIAAMVCALVGRLFLVTAAFQISVWWGIGVFLPFGPLLFRLSYPEEARRAIWFRFATLPCIFMYVLLSPSPILASSRKMASGSSSAISERDEAAAQQKRGVRPHSNPQNELAERCIANRVALEKLEAWGEKLRLQKRDLLHSDVQGNRTYDAEFARYTAALNKATAERTALVTLTK